LSMSGRRRTFRTASSTSSNSWKMKNDNINYKKKLDLTSVLPVQGKTQPAFWSCLELFHGQNLSSDPEIATHGILPLTDSPSILV
jgi:hypothetical protein